MGYPLKSLSLPITKAVDCLLCFYERATLNYPSGDRMTQFHNFITTATEQQK
jgi:hypothetical protein